MNKTPWDELLSKPVETTRKPKPSMAKRVLLGIVWIVLFLIFAIGTRMFLAYITGNQYPWWLF